VGRRARHNGVVWAHGCRSSVRSIPWNDAGTSRTITDKLRIIFIKYDLFSRNICCYDRNKRDVHGDFLFHIHNYIVVNLRDDITLHDRIEHRGIISTPAASNFDHGGRAIFRFHGDEIVGKP
jgi:hypothetical protein